MRGIPFLILAVVIALVDVLVPYLILGNIASFLASYLFWCLITLGTIIFGIIYTRNWGKKS